MKNVQIGGQLLTNRRAFTLIELLAVIVILAIIALIAVPIILNIIEDARKESDERSVELYASAVKNGIVAHQLTGEEIPAGTYSSTDDKTSLTNGAVTFKVEYDGNVECDTIEIHEDGNIYLASCKVNDEEVDYTYGKKQESTSSPSVPFAEDSWETIIANVQAGNLSAYNVGDTKEITLTGDVAGTYTVRIANTSTPEECSTDGYSQTACGFVIEFEDIITALAMNSSATNVGGWESSKMRTYVNSTIYESLPEGLKNGIIKTTVVSGHGSTSGEENFITTDKIYLLSTKEIWGKEGTLNIVENDTAEAETRQLDYYSNLGLSTNNMLGGAIKELNGSEGWWLRSAYSDDSKKFFMVFDDGLLYYFHARYYTIGVAPAFRIG